MIDTYLQTFDTGNGFWNPVVWIVTFIVIFLIVVILRGYGNKSYKKNSEQTKIFLSGNRVTDKQQIQVKASNLYWGWTESMRWIINQLKKIHTGNASDYVLWFVIVMSILFLCVGLM
jgi:hypothetical protein